MLRESFAVSSAIHALEKIVVVEINDAEEQSLETLRTEIFDPQPQKYSECKEQLMLNVLLRACAW